MAQQWVDENLDHLPTTYEEFASYPVRYRKVIYTKLPLQTRAAFWRVHLDRFMAAHDLSPAQLALVQMIRSNISEYLEMDSPAGVDTLYARARKVLGVQLAKEAVINLVPARPAELGEACSCSTVHDGCNGGYRCQKDGDGCDPVACGFLGLDTCNGECLSNQT